MGADPNLLKLADTDADQILASCSLLGSRWLIYPILSESLEYFIPEQWGLPPYIEL